VIPPITGCSGNTDDQQRESVQHGRIVAKLSVSLETLRVVIAKARLELLKTYLVLCVVREINKNDNFVELYSIVFKLESAYFCTPREKEPSDQQG
jgi:hypothetical protein